MSTLLWSAVLLVGGAGSVLRFLIDRAVASRVARSFPLGTLTVNLTGAAALGLISGLALPPDASLLAGTAAVGSYTTFSTWMLESYRLSEERQVWLAAANIVVSIAFGITAAVGGQLIGEHL
jgi:CrcB protein